MRCWCRCCAGHVIQSHAGLFHSTATKEDRCFFFSFFSAESFTVLGLGLFCWTWEIRRLCGWTLTSAFCQTFIFDLFNVPPQSSARLRRVHTKPRDMRFKKCQPSSRKQKIEGLMKKRERVWALIRRRHHSGVLGWAAVNGVWTGDAALSFLSTLRGRGEEVMGGEKS